MLSRKLEFLSTKRIYVSFCGQGFSKGGDVRMMGVKRGGGIVSVVRSVFSVAANYTDPIFPLNTQAPPLGITKFLKTKE